MWPAPPLSPAGQPLAPFGERLLAYLVDGAVLGGVMVALFLPAWIYLGVLIQRGMETAPDGSVEFDLASIVVPLVLLPVGVLLLGLGLGYIYHVETMFRTGQTLGKKVMKLRVVPIDPTGAERVGLTRSVAVRRWSVQQVAGTLLPLFSYVDGLWQLWDKPYQQCLHDKFARTVVVKLPAAPPPGSGAAPPPGPPGAAPPPGPPGAAA